MKCPFGEIMTNDICVAILNHIDDPVKIFNPFNKMS
jgi:hypothetical protein